MDVSSGIIKPIKTKGFFDHINPIAKIISFFLFIVIVFLAQNIASLLLVLLISVLFLLIIRAPLKIFWKSLKPLLFFLPIVLFINMFVIEGAEGSLPIFYIGSQGIYLASFVLTIEIFLRIYLLILLSSVLILSLTETELANSINTLLTPFKYIKVPTEEISLMISIALRYIPLLIYETKIILYAQISRGVDYYSGGIKEKGKAIANIFNPLIVSSFLKAEQLSLAMSSRGYNVGIKRTRYQLYKYRFIDYLYLSFFLIFLGAMITILVIDINLKDLII